MTRHGADLVKDDFERSFVGIREPLKNTGVEKMIKRNTRETPHPQRCETCTSKERVQDKKNFSSWTRCFLLNGEITCERLSLINCVGCASHSSAKSERELWCGDCGFKNSIDCNDETTWKRCRLMSSEPEGKNVEARIELARLSEREKVLDEVRTNYIKYNDIPCPELAEKYDHICDAEYCGICILDFVLEKLRKQGGH